MRSAKEEASSIKISSLLGTLKNRFGILIAVFSIALYAQSISFHYTYDDVTVLTKNNLVKQGISAIPTLIKTDQWFGLNDEAKRVPTYRPIPMVIHALQWQFFDDNSHLYHLFSILLYSLICCVLFMLLCKFFENTALKIISVRQTIKNISTDAPWSLIIPFIATLIYAAHPLHTEVVNNIKSQDEMLCFLFAILSIFLFIKETEKRSLPILILAFIFFTLTLLSKESGISFLMIIPLTLFVFSKAGIKKILIIASVLTFITIIFLIVHSIVVSSISQARIERVHSPYLNSLRDAPNLISQKATAFYILLKYIFQLIFPLHMSYDYSFAHFPIQQLSSPGTLLGILSYLGMGIYAFVNIRKKDPLAFAILFYLITLAPVSNVFLLINSTMGDRFMFMPSLGFCIVVAFLIAKSAKFSPVSSRLRFPIVITIIVVSLYSIRTIARSPDWMDNHTLFAHDVKVVPKNAKAHNDYAVELLFTIYPEEKNRTKKNNLLDSIITEFNTAISIYPDYPFMYRNLAQAYFHKGDFPNAIKNYEIAIHLHASQNPESFSNLGLLYSKIGKFERALNMLDSALLYDSTYTDARINKTSVYLKQGRNEDAIAECDNILKYDATNEKAFAVKGIAYMKLKQFQQSIEFMNKVLAVDSTNPTYLNVISMDYFNLHDTLNANKYHEKAIRAGKAP